MRRVATLLLTSLASAVVAHAQASQTSGGIRGSVKAKDGRALAGAMVTVRNLETGFSRQTAADSQGDVQFNLLPLGTYEVTATSPGHKPGKARLTVQLGQNATLHFALESAEVSAVVEIIAEATPLDTTQVNTFTAIDAKMVEAIPVNGRNFTDLVALTPGAVPADNDRISVGGARGIQNNLTIDGASYNSSFFGEQRGSTRIPFTFGADTIRELQVITNAFDAQYGNAAGAIINAVSKTGTNEFQGSALYYLRPTWLAAKVRAVPAPSSSTTNTPGNLDREFRKVNFNVNVGGPILKDRLHYFVGAERSDRRENLTPDFAVNPSGGNSLANFSPFLANFGGLRVGNDGRTLAQEGGRAYTQEVTNTVYFARLDWALNSDHRATLRVNAQELEGQNYTTSLYSSFASTTFQTSQGLEKDTGLSWVLEFNSVFGSNMVNEARLQRAIERRPRFANTTASPEIIVSNGFSAGQNNFLPNGLDEFTWQFIDNISLYLGNWTLKAGVDLQKLEYENTFFRYQNGAFQFGSYDVANRWRNGAGYRPPSGPNPNPGGLRPTDFIQYQGSYSDFGGKIAYGGSLYAGYVQAQWQVPGGRLTLNGGLRYTRESWDSNPRPNPQFQGLDQAPTNQALDPRFGFTLDVFGDQKTVVRGGYGYFSTPNPGLTVSNTMNSNGNTTSTFRIANSSGSTDTTDNPLFLTGASGILSYSQRVTSGGTVLTALPDSYLRDPGSYGLAVLPKQGQVWDPDADMTRKKLAALAVEQDLGRGFIAGFRAEYAEFENLQYFVNINLGQPSAPGTYYNDGYASTVNAFSSSARPGIAKVRGRMLNFSGFNDVFLSRYDGEGDYKAIIFTLSRKLDKGWGFTSSLTWSKSLDNNSNERSTASPTSDSNTNNPADPLSNFSYSTNDRRFRGVVAGYFPLGWRIQGSAILTYTTGRPFSATVSNSDLNGDGARNDYMPGTVRNGFRQPHSKTFDLRVMRNFRIVGKFALEAQIDMFNVLNWANWTTDNDRGTANADGTNAVFSSNFGQLNQVDRRTREVQLGLRARW